MENKYKELFNKISPRMSDEELLNAVLDRKAVNMNEKKRFNKKAIIIPAVAAAVVLGTTIGVSAAYEWNLPAAISDIFGKNSENIPDGVNFKDFNFAAVGGKELTDVLKYDGYEVQMKGIAADPHHMLLFFDVVTDDPDIEINDGEALAVMPHIYTDFLSMAEYYHREGAAGTEDDPYFLPVEESLKKIIGGGQGDNIYLGTEGNIAHYCYKEYDFGVPQTGKSQEMDFEYTYKVDANTGDFLEYISKTPTGEDVLKYTINLDFFDDSQSIDILRDTEVTFSDGLSGTLTHMQITPFGLCIKVNWGELDVTREDIGSVIGTEVFDEFKIKFKDGTVMDNSAFEFSAGEPRSSKITGGDGTEHTIYAHEAKFEWLYPVNVADIEALIVGNTTVPVNN